MRRRAALILLLAALGLGAVGCGEGEEARPLPATVEGTVPQETETEAEAGEAGGEGQGDAEAGKEIFASQGCGGCHVLADAGTSGSVGPNLDESQPPFDLVVDRVTNGRGAMPSFKDSLSEEEIRNVAAYVSSVAGQ